MYFYVHVSGLSIVVLPRSEVWSGDQLIIKCKVKSEVGVIWVREPFSDEEEIVEKELIAHDEHVLVEDTRFKVENEKQQEFTISTLKASCVHNILPNRLHILYYFRYQMYRWQTLAHSHVFCLNMLLGRCLRRMLLRLCLKGLKRKNHERKF